MVIGDFDKSFLGSVIGEEKLIEVSLRGNRRGIEDNKFRVIF